MTPAPTPQPGPVLRHRPFAPRVQYWPTGSRSTSRSYTNADYETSSEYSDPSDRKRYRYTAEDSCAIEDDPVDEASFTTEDPMAVSECTKLKGVYWPGMDIFDSATPEMRRKRNQKKDSSVVEQLELNSQGVEPTELIFTPQGSFKKQRRISSSVYDDEDLESSPIKSESPKPYLMRPALADLDVNATRRARQLVRPVSFPYLSRSQYIDDQDRPEYGYGEHAPRRKRAFDVFQDEEISFAQPAAFNYLTATYHNRGSPTPAPAQAFAPFKTFNDTYQYESKENVMPSYQQPAYEHHHPAASYHYPSYSYGLGHDHQAFHYHNAMYMRHDNTLSNTYQPSSHEEGDDQRTLTAPPSPSTG